MGKYQKNIKYCITKQAFDLFPHMNIIPFDNLSKQLR